MRTLVTVVTLLGTIALAIVAVSALQHASARTRTVPSARVIGQAHLLVTRDFGLTTLVDRKVQGGGGRSVMDVLGQNAHVATAYGGGFVNTLEGLSSGYTGSKSQRTDWFYYVNGFIANESASSYPMLERDRVWWDYHRWDFVVAVPAVVGMYPEPFLSGYRGRTLRSRSFTAPASPLKQARSRSLSGKLALPASMWPNSVLTCNLQPTGISS